MQNTIKIVFLVLLTIIPVVSCKDTRVDETFYQYTTMDSDSIIPFDQSNLKFIKENLYVCNDTLYLGMGLFEDTFNDQSNSIESKRKGTLLFNTTRYNISIDTGSYAFLIPDLIASDKNKVLAFPKGNYKLPHFEELKLNPKNLIQIDNDNTYLKDSNYVYCIPTNSYIDVDSKTFEIEIRRSVVFGKSGNQYYYMNEPIDLQDFFQDVK